MTTPLARIIGITGNIGAGKSVVSDYFKLKGYPVFLADQAGQIILTKNKSIVKKITDLFGDSILDDQGFPDRKKIAAIVFNDPKKLDALNSIIHPEVGKLFSAWLKEQQAPFVIRETAILFEKNLQTDSYKNIVVTCPFEVRVERVMKRNGLTKEQIIEREKNQMSESEKIAKADFVVNNHNEPLIPQLEKIIEELNSGIATK